MDMSGEHQIAVPREQVWQALNDPEVLKLCIPGCDSLEGTPEEGFRATVTQRIGPVKARFSGKVRLEDVDAPNGYTIQGEGEGGVAGFAKGGAKVSLADGENGGTVLSYTVNAQIGGKLAQLGSRLIDSTARKLANKFFDNFEAHLKEKAGV